jgi:hypothetical protein
MIDFFSRFLSEFYLFRYAKHTFRLIFFNIDRGKEVDNGEERYVLHNVLYGHVPLLKT